MKWYSILLVLVILTANCLAAPAAKEKETYGCESNPTGDPIGGGAGYSRHVKKIDFKVKTADELIEALGKAKSGQVIYVDEYAYLDLTDYNNITIPGGVTLAGGRGKNGSLGAMLYTKDQGVRPFLTIGGDGVRITGLRIQGPDPERRTDQMNRLRQEGGSKGYYSVPLCAAIYTVYDIEVDNCEISCWSHCGIGFIGRKPGVKGYIHHNYIHHTQRTGLGYGIHLGMSSAKIEANRFDWNRHCIDGEGSPSMSYEACYNLVGPHVTASYFGTHAFRGRGGEKISPASGGKRYDIHHNTFYWPIPREGAVIIKGVPSEGAFVHHNWFVDSPKIGWSAAQSGAPDRGNFHVYDNVIGPDKSKKAEEIHF